MDLPPKPSHPPSLSLPPTFSEDVKLDDAISSTIHQLLKHIITDFLQNSCHKDACFWCERMVSWFPLDGEARVLWAKSLLKLREYRACDEVLSRTIDFKPTIRREARYLQAQACVGLKDAKRGQKVLGDLLDEMEESMESLSISEAAAVNKVSIRLLRSEFLKLEADQGTREDELSWVMEANPFSWDAFGQLCDLGKTMDVDSLFSVSKCMAILDNSFYDKIKDTVENKEPRQALSPKSKGTVKTVSPQFFYGIRPTEPPPKKVAKKVEPAKPPAKPSSLKRPALKPQEVKPAEKKRDRGGNVIEDKKKLKTHVESALAHLLNVIRVMAKGYYHLTRYECSQAIEQFNQLPSCQLQSGTVLEWMGRAYFEMANYQKAHQYFDYCRHREPWRVSGTDIHSVTLWHMRNFNDLAHLAHHLALVAPDSPQRYIAAGNCFSLRQEHEAAINCFEKATLVDPHCAYAFTLIGHEHVLNEDLDQAMKSFRTAATEDSRHYNAWYGMGSIFYRQGNYQLAQSHFGEALAINSTNPILICYDGMVLQKLNRHHEALERFLLAESLAPDNPLIAFRKAHQLAAMDRFQEALNVLNNLKNKTQEFNVYFLLGTIYKKLGDARQALLAFTLAEESRYKDSHLKASIGKLRNEEDDEQFEVVAD